MAAYGAVLPHELMELCWLDGYRHGHDEFLKHIETANNVIKFPKQKEVPPEDIPPGA